MHRVVKKFDEGDPSLWHFNDEPDAIKSLKKQIDFTNDMINKTETGNSHLTFSGPRSRRETLSYYWCCGIESREINDA
jgi:hypothetical protein